MARIPSAHDDVNPIERIVLGVNRTCSGDHARAVIKGRVTKRIQTVASKRLGIILEFVVQEYSQREKGSDVKDAMVVGQCKTRGQERPTQNLCLPLCEATCRYRSVWLVSRIFCGIEALVRYGKLQEIQPSPKESVRKMLWRCAGNGHCCKNRLKNSELKKKAGET